ncbi:metallophosphoesterase [Paenibacillus sp. PAMC21692]|uniref:metallophosphoesterase n=1 Tax=Paenibacillus sp. PAMC21692 TaxID=2762320 RepID=UPI0021C3E9F8|nr:metallophosphoesterase [Paenibacillus sp. PAMC21692]
MLKRLSDLIIVLIALIGMSALFYLLLIMPTQWLKIERVAHPIGLGKRFLQISDLHVDMLRIGPDKLEAVVRAEKPDYIVLTGDYTYRREYLPRLALYLKAITAAGVPVYAVLGNHDYQQPRPREMLTLFREQGIAILRNGSVSLPEFTLIGIDNYSTGHSRISEAFLNIERSKPAIVITHDPNVVLKIRQNYDYLMAGHFHGKQFNIPYFFKLKPKGPLSQRGIYRGLHRSEQGAYFISKGIGQAGVNARFMVRSEVTVHEL